MSSFHHAFVCIGVYFPGIAWLIITLQIIALSHCCLGLVHNVGPLFPKSFSAQRSCFCAGTEAIVRYEVFFECLCLARVPGCKLLSAIKRCVL